MFKIIFAIILYLELTIQVEHNYRQDIINRDKEQELIDKLLKKYDKKSRPSGTLNVKFSLNLNQIINLIEKDQIMVLNAFIDHEWIDKRLTWNPLDYGNVSIIRIYGDQIWTPDTFIYTTADQSGFLLPQTGAYFVINHQGVIFWPNPLTQMRVRCRMDIIWFPFDEQLCIITFGSWSYTSNFLNYTLMNENPVIENYTEHNEWSLIEYKPFRYEIKFSNWIEDDTFSEIRYKILIRRKPLFVIQNCVFPALMLCLLTLVSFFIPFPQAMQIGISIMLSFSVFKLRLSDDVPVQSDSIPLINIYFTLCMTFSLTAMVWFSIVNLLKEHKKVPNCCKILVLRYICYIMCIKVDKNIHQFSNKKKKIVSSEKREILISENSKRKFSIKSCNKRSKFKLTESDEEYGFGSFNNKYSNQVINEKYSKTPKIVWLPQKNQSRIDKRIERIDSGMLISTNANHNLSKNNQNANTTRYHLITNMMHRNMNHDSSRSSSSNSKSTHFGNFIDESVLTNDKFIKSKFKNRSRSKTFNRTNFILDELKNHYERNSKKQLSEENIINILNKFVFFLFLIFIVSLHIISLIILPYFIKTPLSIED